MSSTPLTLENLKRQARRLRDHFAEKNIEISHSASLEALAKQHGYKDWNVLSALAKRLSENPAWPALDDKITGSYRGHTFTGKILKIKTAPLANTRGYTIRFDEAIDVVTSKHFTNFRQQINCILDQTLSSVDHKGRQDNFVHIT